MSNGRVGKVSTCQGYFEVRAISNIRSGQEINIREDEGICQECFHRHIKNEGRTSGPNEGDIIKLSTRDQPSCILSLSVTKSSLGNK